MNKPLLLSFHPDISKSRTNRALLQSAATLQKFEIIDVGSGLNNGHFCIDDEVNRLKQARSIIFQFPFYWYSVPPLMKQWLDEVITHMFYVNYELDGKLIEGKSLYTVITAGNSKEAYSNTGSNIFTVEELIRPLQATANRCKLNWKPPFVVYGAMKLTPDERNQYSLRYKDYLAEI